jgi:hypothetical protein
MSGPLDIRGTALLHALVDDCVSILRLEGVREGMGFVHNTSVSPLGHCEPELSALCPQHVGLFQILTYLAYTSRLLVGVCGTGSEANLVWLRKSITK